MSRSRLLTGSAEGKLVAGVEIEMAQGWKTYWRSPGESGVPPSFDWAGSENLAGATVLYPAPRRFTDPTGDTIGYGDAVIFPVELQPQDPSKPVRVRLKLDYGICKHICVPAEESLAAEIDGAGAGIPHAVEAALAQVPRHATVRKEADPVLKGIETVVTGDKPHIVLEAQFPGGTSGADAFVEAGNGTFVPPPRQLDSRGTNTLRFIVDLDDADELEGQTLTVTLVSDAGVSETHTKLP